MFFTLVIFQLVCCFSVTVSICCTSLCYHTFNDPHSFMSYLWLRMCGFHYIGHEFRCMSLLLGAEPV